MTDAELLALGESIYNAQPSDLDGGTPLHDHPRREAILIAWARALTSAAKGLSVSKDERGLVITSGEGTVIMPAADVAATFGWDLDAMTSKAGGKAASAATSIDKALRKNAAAASYATDAKDIARVLVRHYGDEAEAVIDLLPSELVHARIKGKR